MRLLETYDDWRYNSIKWLFGSQPVFIETHSFQWTNGELYLEKGYNLFGGKNTMEIFYRLSDWGYDNDDMLTVRRTEPNRVRITIGRGLNTRGLAMMIEMYETFGFDQEDEFCTDLLY